MEKNEQFEYWLEVREKCMIGLEGYCAINIYVIEHFNQLPPAFQWGVYLEFFDSVGINVKCNRGARHLANRRYFCIIIDKLRIDTTYLDRYRAQQEAIKKAFEILNSK